jgi:tetratricopeptide (TPR) repeat protein
MRQIIELLHNKNLQNILLPYSHFLASFQFSRADVKGALLVNCLHQETEITQQALKEMGAINADYAITSISDLEKLISEKKIIPSMIEQYITSLNETKKTVSATLADSSLLPDERRQNTNLCVQLQQAIDLLSRYKKTISLTVKTIDPETGMHSLTFFKIKKADIALYPFSDFTAESVFAKTDFKYTLMLGATFNKGEEKITRKWLKNRRAINAESAITSIEDLKKLIGQGKIKVSNIEAYSQQLKAYIQERWHLLAENLISHDDPILQEQLSIVTEAHTLLLNYQSWVKGILEIRGKQTVEEFIKLQKIPSPSAWFDKGVRAFKKGKIEQAEQYIKQAETLFKAINDYELNATFTLSKKCLTNTFLTLNHIERIKNELTSKLARDNIATIMMLTIDKDISQLYNEAKFCLGKNHPEIAYTLVKAAYNLLSQHQIQNKMDLAKCQSLLAACHFELDEFDDAIQNLQIVRDTYVKWLGEAHADVRAIDNRLTQYQMIQERLTPPATFRR